MKSPLMTSRTSGRRKISAVPIVSSRFSGARRTGLGVGNLAKYGFVSMASLIAGAAELGATSVISVYISVFGQGEGMEV